MTGEKLVGKRIVHYVETEYGFILTLDDDSKVEVDQEGGPGIDSGWYDWLVMKINGVQVLRK